jgi:hypothetical protein
MRQAEGVTPAMGAVFLAGCTTYLGWCRPVMGDRFRTAPRWTTSVTLLYLVTALASGRTVQARSGSANPGVPLDRSPVTSVTDLRRC